MHNYIIRTRFRELTTQHGSFREEIIEADEAEAEQRCGYLGPFVGQEAGLPIGVRFEQLRERIRHS